MTIRSMFAAFYIVAVLALLTLLGPPFAATAQSISFAADPCFSSQPKSSAVVNISTAATTQLIAAPSSPSQSVYVCAFSMTISQVITTANTLKFVQGSGVNCGTGTADLSGPFGTGGVTAGSPLSVQGFGATLFKASPGNAICATTTIGASAAFSGFVSYAVQ